jgi:hypothetical protein
VSRALFDLQGCAGLRPGEASTLTWVQYDAKKEPLGCIGLDVTKTDCPRDVPVHGALAKMLAAWKLGGWERCYGRAPKPEDLVTPTLTMEPRNDKDALETLHEDLGRLGLRPRRRHDLRGTFISLAQTDGALPHVLKRVTHGEPKAIFDLYTTFQWPVLCAEVAKLRVEVCEGKVLEMDPARRQQVTFWSRRARRRWNCGGNSVSPVGIEPTTSGLRVRCSTN